MTDLGDERRKQLAQTRVRDHLANERTYLAWLRTGVTVMVLGLAVAKFVDNLTAASIAAGTILLVVGALGVAYGTVRYRQVTIEIDSDTYEPGTRGYAAVISSTVLVVAVVAAMVILIAGR
jgi:putative membrane protein